MRSSGSAYGNWPHNQLDEMIHQRTRLAIMAALAGVEGLEFNQVKAELGLTDGNLSTHAAALEKAGYIRIDKDFNGRKPRTTLPSPPRAGRPWTTTSACFREYWTRRNSGICTAGVSPVSDTDILPVSRD